MNLEERFQWLLKGNWDIVEHLEDIRKLAGNCSHITEFGTRRGVSTTALLCGLPKKLVCYDLEKLPDVEELAALAADNGVEFEFNKKDTRTVNIEKTDLLLIDTLHDCSQLRAELKNAKKVSKYIIIHDTFTFGIVGQSKGERGLLLAISEFLKSNPWKISKFKTNNNGLIVLEKNDE